MQKSSYTSFLSANEYIGIRLELVDTFFLLTDSVLFAAFPGKIYDKISTKRVRDDLFCLRDGLYNKMSNSLPKHNVSHLQRFYYGNDHFDTRAFDIDFLQDAENLSNTGLRKRTGNRKLRLNTAETARVQFVFTLVIGSLIESKISIKLAYPDDADLQCLADNVLSRMAKLKERHIAVIADEGCKPINEQDLVEAFSYLLPKLPLTSVLSLPMNLTQIETCQEVNA